MEEVYIVTGAAGHLGSVVAQELLGQGKKVRAFILPGEELLFEGAKVYYGNVCDISSLEELFEQTCNKAVYVIHCAGIVSIKSTYDERVEKVNVFGTINVADLCLRHCVKMLVYVSSVHAIKEKPKGETITETDDFSPEYVTGLYAKTKARATSYILSKTKEGLNALVVHPSGIIGPGDNGHNHLVALIRDYYSGKLKAAINGGYDFVDVRDVALGILSSLKKGKCGECYILSNAYYSIRDFLSIAAKVSGKKEIQVYLPLWFIKVVAPFAELYYKLRKVPPLFTAYSIYTLQTNACFSNEKAKKNLDYHTRPMEDTIKDSIEYMKKSGGIK